MSRQYDYYLEQHKGNVAKAFNWIKENLPELIVDMGTVDYEHQICFLHDHSKSQSDEYEAYDAYFYGGNRSYQVVQNFNHAWVKHIHRNPHHWQHWILLNDDPNEGEIILDMPYNYILEMICDWWAFSWNKGNLREIFDWWNEHREWIKLSDKTRETVVYILSAIAKKLNELEDTEEDEDVLAHHGIKGQKWGVRRYQNSDGTLTEEGKEHYSKFGEMEQNVINKLSNHVSKINKQPIDILEVKTRGNVDDKDAQICADLANKIFDKAAKVEPKITEDVVTSVDNSGSKMYGLEYRLKQPTSIAGKIAADAKEKGISYKEAASEIKDSIRYTSVSDTKDFVNNYTSIKNILRNKGYEEIKCKNYFESYKAGKVMHKSVQSTFSDKDGNIFELQFQTPSSQAAKELKLPLYEERRKSNISESRAKELEASMRDLAEKVKDPDRIEYIESH